MKFNIERSVLLKAMALGHSVVESANTIPILSNMMLKSEGDRLRLTSTDLDIMIEQAVPATVEAGGGTTVHSRTLFDIVKKLPDGAVVGCELADNRLTVRAGRSRFQLQTLPVEDFPYIANTREGARFTMEASAFHRLIGGPLYAVSTEETRYYLNGVYLHCREAQGDIAACATNGHQLALYWDDRPGGAEGMPGVIVPRKTCGLLARHLDGVKGEATISVAATRMTVQWGQSSLTTKLIDGTFPDYERVVPRGNQLVADIAAEAIKASVARVITVSEEKSSGVKLRFKRDAIELYVSNSEGGSATDQVDVSYVGPEMSIGFNAKYLITTIDALDDEAIRMAISDAGSAAVFTPASGRNCMAVIMPLRVLRLSRLNTGKYAS